MKRPCTQDIYFYFTLCFVISASVGVVVVVVAVVVVVVVFDAVVVCCCFCCLFLISVIFHIQLFSTFVHTSFKHYP